MLILILLSVICSAKSTSTYPVLPGLLTRRAINSTADKPSAWVGTPNVRGTSDIIYACFSTLILCAWTAYHPNVLPKKEMIYPWVKPILYFIMKALWMFFAIFMPELVLWQAWNQYCAARTLRDEVNKIGKSRASQNTASCKICSSDRNQVRSFWSYFSYFRITF